MKYNITENRKNNKLLIFSIKVAVLIPCVLVLGFLGKATFNAYMEKRKSEKSAEEARTELQKLEERHIFVLSELLKFSTESGIEVKLREKFGVGRVGEQVAIIIDAENPDNEIDGNVKFLSLDKIKEFFKGLFKRYVTRESFY